MRSIQTMTTDVLVVGGGIAGCFAALSARKAGADVLLIDKGYVSSSGQTPYAGSFAYFDPEKDDLQEWLENVRFAGDYIANLDFTTLTFLRSKECVEDMIAYGATFERNADGSLRTRGQESVAVAVAPDVKTFPLVLRKAVLAQGACILDRTMALELMVQEGKVCGVFAMTVGDAQPIAIAAKSVILSTGASALKPPGWPVSNLTGDGDMMAYRAGVAITGKEFVDAHVTSSVDPSALSMNPFKKPPHGGPHGGPGERRGPHGGHPPHGEHGGPPHGGPGEGGGPPHGHRGPMIKNAYGETVKLTPNLNLGIEFEIHAGRGPMEIPKGRGGPPGMMQRGPMVSCASHGMACHKAEGIWPESVSCSTSLPGLYGAGDSLGTMTSGAAYAQIGLALAGSAVTGKVAGESAGEYVKEVSSPILDMAAAEALADAVYAPLQRKGGFTADWLIAYLQNITMPYFVLIVKEESRLQSVLSQVRYAKTHIVPKLYATDAHDLRTAIEAKNMVENLEVKLIAALARKESRGTHYREDYPMRDEENFSAWLTVRCQAGEAIVEKHELPQAWKWKAGEPRLVDFPTPEQLEGGVTHGH